MVLVELLFFISLTSLKTENAPEEHTSTDITVTHNQEIIAYKPIQLPMTTSNSIYSMKLTIGSHHFSFGYTNRRQILIEHITQLIQTEESAIQKFITNALQEIEMVFSKSYQDESIRNHQFSNYGMEREDYLNHIHSISDCYYNNIERAHLIPSLALNVEGRINCYSDIIDAIVVLLIHMNQIRNLFSN